MGKKTDKIMQTEPVRIDIDVMEIVRSVKKHTGLPLGRFIEEAIVEKVARLPKKVLDKIVPSVKK